MITVIAVVDLGTLKEASPRSDSALNETNIFVFVYLLNIFVNYKKIEQNCRFT